MIEDNWEVNSKTSKSTWASHKMFVGHHNDYFHQDFRPTGGRLKLIKED